MVAVHSEDHHLLGMMWDGALYTYVDTALPSLTDSFLCADIQNLPLMLSLITPLLNKIMQQYNWF